MRPRAAALVAAMTAALVSLTGLTSAAASTASPLTKAPGVAGYHFLVARSATSLTLKSEITVPRSSCGSGTFSPHVSAEYVTGTSVHTASVALALGCFSILPVYGDAVLVVGSATRNIHHPLKPGAVVTITVTIRRSGVSVKIAYSRTSSASLKGRGGRPIEGQFAVALPNPPRYTPVKFTGCAVNGRRLAAFRPGVWESVTRSGKVDGKPSALTRGTNFTISY